MKNKNNHILKLAALLLALATAQSTSAQQQTVKVCYKSELPNGGGSFSLNGVFRQFAAEKRLNPANFGPSRISNICFQLYGFVPQLFSEVALIANGCQVLGMGINENDAGEISNVTSYTATEVAEIKNLTIGANDRMVLAFQGFSTALGGSGYQITGIGNDNPNSLLTTTGQALLSEVFGMAQYFDQGSSFQGIFATYPSTASVVVNEPSGDVTGVINCVNGDAYLTDVDLITNLGDLTQSPAIISSTDKFFANLYHSMAKIVLNKSTDACMFFECAAGTNPPALSTTSATNVCPATTVNLSAVGANNFPFGTTMTWHSGTPATTANKLANVMALGAGTYYAAFFDATGNCYSPTAALAATVVNCASCNAGSVAPTVH